MADASVDGAPDAMAPDAAPPRPTPPVPDFTLGEAIDAAPLSWTWVPFEDSQCMDGTPFGIGVNHNPDSENVVIFFEGGNLCFDPVSCLGVANLDGFTEAKLASFVNIHVNGIFSREDPVNPLRDWSYVYIPYCSGDLHIGNTLNGYHQPGWDEPNVHVGYANTRRFMERVVPTYADAQKVLVAGESAGGFGAIGNFHQIAEAFESVGSEHPALYLLDDSGPTMGTTWLKPCFQELVIDAFGYLDTPLAEDCPACLDPVDGGLGQIIPFLTNRYPDARMSLLSTTEDRTIRAFYGYGYFRTCDFPAPMPAEDYTAGLVELRDELIPDGANFHTYIVEDDFHTMGSRRLDHESTGGGLGDWLRQQLEDDATWSDVWVEAPPAAE